LYDKALKPPTFVRSRNIRLAVFVGVAIALCLLAIAVGLALFRDGASDEDRVAELLRQETAAINAGDWAGMYGYTDPEFRARCSQDELAAAMDRIRTERRNQFGSGDVTISEVSVKVQGDRASVTYSVQVGGTAIGAIAEPRPDTFRKVDGAWRDVDETPNDCAI
jgi:hypothetical protein